MEWNSKEESVNQGAINVPKYLEENLQQNTGTNLQWNI